MLAVAAFTLLAAIVGCDWWIRRSENAWPAAVVRVFDAAAGNSLAGWLRAGTLAGAAAFASLVYLVRRHRTDDYRGSYRVWLWAAAWLLVMSADQVAGLREACEAACTQATGWGGPGRGAVWWIVPCGLAAAAIGGRLAIEMRECRTSTGFLLGSAGVWTLSEGLRIANGAAASPGSIVAAACGVLAQWGIAVAMSVHARYVVLDAAGELRRRKKKAKPNVVVEDAAAKENRRETVQLADAKPAANRPLSGGRPVEPPRPNLRMNGRDTDEDAEEDSGAHPRSAGASGGNANHSSSSAPRPTLTFGAPSAGEERKLSKAERKQMKQMRRAA
jgi:hypothetical protein